MKISELVERLEAILTERGDVHVMVRDGDDQYPIGPQSIYADAECDGTRPADEETEEDDDEPKGKAEVLVVAVIDLTASLEE